MIRQLDFRINPAQDKITVRFSEPLQAEGHLEVLDAAGTLKRVLRVAAKSQSVEILTTSLPTGTYFLRCADGEKQSQPAKFSVKH